MDSMVLGRGFPAWVLTEMRFALESQTPKGLQPAQVSLQQKRAAAPFPYFCSEPRSEDRTEGSDFHPYTYLEPDQLASFFSGLTNLELFMYSQIFRPGELPPNRTYGPLNPPIYPSPLSFKFKLLF